MVPIISTFRIPILAPIICASLDTRANSFLLDLFQLSVAKEAEGVAKRVFALLGAN